MTTSQTKLIAFAISATAAILFGFVFVDLESAQTYIRDWAYWIVLFTSIAFGAFVINAYKTTLLKKAKSPQEIIIFICIAILGLFLFTRESPELKVYYDEPTLLSTAKTMHEKRTAAWELPSKSIFGAAQHYDKRPLFFPTLLSSIHDVFGYSASNVFRLNFILTIGCLYLTFILARKLVGNTQAAAVGTLLLASHPLMSHNASGGGFELLNLSMILFTAISAERYLRDKSPLNQNLLIFSTILLCQTRYESATFAVSTISIIVVALYRSSEINISRSAILSPLLLLPVAWQHCIIRATSEFWQSSELRPTPFSLEYLRWNLESLSEFLLVGDRMYPSSPIMSGIGIIVFLFSLLVITRTWGDKTHHTVRIAWVSFLVIICLNLGILMIYSWGQLNSFIGARLALPLILVFSISAATVYSYSTPKWRRVLQGCLAISLAFGVVAASNPTYSTLNLHQKRYHWLKKEIKPLAENRSILLISSGSTYWNVQGINSIPFERALLGSENIALHQVLNTYDDIYVIQYLTINDTGKEFITVLNSGYELGPAFKLSEIVRTSLHPFNMTSISRVNAIDISEIRKLGGPLGYKERFGSEPTFRYISPPEQLDTWIKYLP